MNFHDQIPVEFSHFLERDISEDTSVVDDDIDSSESINCSLTNLVSEFDTVVVGDGLGVHNGGNCHFICF